MIVNKSSRYIILLLITINISNCKTVKNKEEIIFMADREAPIGWVYLKIYSDSTFEFSGKKFIGKVHINKDTLLFNYNDSIPKVGKQAVIKGDYLEYVLGLKEKLKITTNKLLY